MSKATINTLQLLRAKFAQKIAECDTPETDVQVIRIYLPLYEISAVMLLAAQEAKKTEYRDTLENRAALSLVKSQLKDLQQSGYRYGARNKAVQEAQQEISVLHDIANDLLA